MQEKKIYKRFTVVVVFIIIAIVAYIVFINRSRLVDVITPFIIGALIAYILNPLVGKLQIKKIPRWAAIALVYLGFLILIAISLCYFIPKLYSNISDLILNIPDYTEEYNKKFSSFQAQIDYSALPQQVKDIVISQMQANIIAIRELFLAFLKNSLGAINSVFSLFFNFILALFIAFYILKDLELFKARMRTLIPRRWRGMATSAAGEINVLIAGFIQGQLLIAVIVAALEIVGLSIAGVKYAFILGIIGGIANIIPYFGPFIGVVPAVTIALLDSPLRALFAVLVFVIVQQIDNAVITPRIMSERCGMHPLLIIFVVLLGGSLFGVLGLILAVPATAVIKVIGKKVIERIV